MLSTLIGWQRIQLSDSAFLSICPPYTHIWYATTFSSSSSAYGQTSTSWRLLTSSGCGHAGSAKCVKKNHERCPSAKLVLIKIEKCLWLITEGSRLPFTKIDGVSQLNFNYTIHVIIYKKIMFCNLKNFPVVLLLKWSEVAAFQLLLCLRLADELRWRNSWCLQYLWQIFHSYNTFSVKFLHICWHKFL